MRIGITTWLGLLLLASPITAAVAQPAAAASNQMISVDGHRIAFHVTPGHGPIIVLDAGGGLDSSYWDSFVPVLSKRTGAEIITYDRASFGASDDVNGPWSVQSATRDLEAGLKALHATHNVVLVSHSLAGEIATYITRAHPTWFTGAVLVDANVPDVFTDDFIAKAGASYAPMIAAAKAAPPSKAGRQLLSVSASFAETSRAFHRVTWPNAVPVVVIVSEKTPLDSPAAAQWWRDAHARFARRAANRQLVTAARSSHDVAHDRPDVILTAIVDVIGGRP
jgi:pimeloyl-ACP methyl ester carboxylesterase